MWNCRWVFALLLCFLFCSRFEAFKFHRAQKTERISGKNLVSPRFFLFLFCILLECNSLVLVTFHARFGMHLAVLLLSLCCVASHALDSICSNLMPSIYSLEDYMFVN